MSQPPTRRRALSIAAGTAAAVPLAQAATPATAASAPTTAAPSLAPVPTTWAVRPFTLDQVTLGDGVFRRKRDLMLDYARSYPADRILAVFRANAGLDTRGARPPGGWETADGNLRSHYGGHFLTLVAQAYADTREAALKAKLDHLVAALAECQQALAEHGTPRPSHPGFLAAYPETQFVLLESYTTYPTIWAPYYTCHKIMRGLLDAHTLAGNAQALQIASKMGDWVHSRLGHLPKAQLERMWSIYIAGEYGGMNEVMADLYALTGRAEHLAAARCFDNTALLDACAEDRDILEGRHANQHIPQFTGYLRLFDHTGEARYAAAALNFFGMVAGPRTYSLGGTGQGELFRARGAIAATVRRPAEAVPGSYLTLSRNWRRGDRVQISMPYRLRIERALDDPSVQSVFHGPVLLVARSPEQGFRAFSFYKDFTLRGDLADAVRPEGRPLHFTTHGLTLAPFFVADDTRYHAYFRRAEPVVVFGAADSGVPNRARADGLTFLDVLWARAPFSTQGGFVEAVRVLADDWLSRGVFTRAERDAVVTAAVRANLRR